MHASKIFCRFFFNLKPFRSCRRSVHRLYVPKCERTDQELEEVVRKIDHHIENSRRLFVITGAGISTESGIRDYRSEDVGLYAISESRPIQYADFLNSAANRKRYWARNYVGWDEFSTREPNTGHFCPGRARENRQNTLAGDAKCRRSAHQSWFSKNLRASWLCTQVVYGCLAV